MSDIVSGAWAGVGGRGKVGAGRMVRIGVIRGVGYNPKSACICAAYSTAL